MAIDLVQAQRLDRLADENLLAVDGEACVGGHLGGVTRMNAPFLQPEMIADAEAYLSWEAVDFAIPEPLGGLTGDPERGRAHEAEPPGPVSVSHGDAPSGLSSTPTSPAARGSTSGPCQGRAQSPRPSP